MKKKNGKANNNDKKEQPKLGIKSIINFLGFAVSIVSLVISIMAMQISRDQAQLEYRKNLPNLNMNVEKVVNEDTGKAVLKYQIHNSGGSIREAKIKPHIYMEYLLLPETLDGELEGQAVIEIRDFFAPHYGNNIYYDSSVPYNSVDNGWFFEIEEDRLDEGWLLADSIGEAEPLYSETMICLSLCLEVNYVDLLGNKHVEWYNATTPLSADIDDYMAFSAQPAELKYVEEASMSEYQNSVGVNMEDLVQNGDICNQSGIEEVFQWCCKELFGSGA